MSRPNSKHMSNLTTNTRDTLVELYHVAQGEVGVYLEATVHHLTLTALSRRNYISLQMETVSGKRIRHAALTRRGAKFVRELIPTMEAGTNSATAKQRFQPMDTRKRQPVTVHFDVANEQHTATLSRIGELKQHRTFTADLCRLLEMNEQLHAGETFLLACHYPHIIEAIRSEAVLNMTAENAGLLVENDALRHMLAQEEQRIAELEAQLSQRQPAHADFEAMLRSISTKLDNINAPQTPKNGANSSAAANQGGEALSSIKTLNTPAIEAPRFDDDDDLLLEVKQDTSAGQRAGENFIRSMMALQDKAS